MSKTGRPKIDTNLPLVVQGPRKAKDVASGRVLLASCCCFLVPFGSVLNPKIDVEKMDVQKSTLGCRMAEKCEGRDRGEGPFGSTLVVLGTLLVPY